MTASYPRTAEQFESMFADEDKCRARLIKVRWPKGFQCPRCGGSGAWETNRGTWYCRGCSTQTSVTAGTVFHRSRTPLREWFRLMWLVAAPGTSVNAVGLLEELQPGGYPTAFGWLARLRQVMARAVCTPIEGIAIVDLCRVGGKKADGGQLVGGAAVVVVVEDLEERGAGRVRLKYLPKVTKEAVGEFVRSAVISGGIVRTGNDRGYSVLLDLGFQWRPSPWMETEPARRAADKLNDWIRRTYHGGIQRSHLQSYLDEFCFRMDRLRPVPQGRLFRRLLEAAVGAGAHAPAAREGGGDHRGATRPS